MNEENKYNYEGSIIEGIVERSFSGVWGDNRTHTSIALDNDPDCEYQLYDMCARIDIGEPVRIYFDDTKNISGKRPDPITIDILEVLDLEGNVKFTYLPYFKYIYDWRKLK